MRLRAARRSSSSVALTVVAVLVPVVGLGQPVSAHGTLVLVSAPSGDGTGAPGPSGTYGISLSEDGSSVAFASASGRLLAADSDNEVDVYVRRSTGELLLASTSSSGTKASTFSLRPSLDAGGDRVAFMSAAADLHPDDDDGFTDVFVKDLTTGQLRLASTDAAGDKGNADSALPDLSADGRRVAFTSRADDLLPEQDADREVDVYVKDLDSGELLLATQRADGRRVPPGPYGVGRTSLSADGTRVAFDTDAALVEADTDGAPDVYVKDLDTGALVLASASAGGANSARGSYRPSLSADGRVVAFDSFSADLTPDDRDEDGDVYVKDLTSGTLVLGSVGAGGKGDGRSTEPSLSDDGSRVAFSSEAANLDGAGPDARLHTYVTDLTTSRSVLASVGPAGPADRLSISPTLSGDGSSVAFATPAGNLDVSDTNVWADVYLAALHEPPPEVDRTAPHVELSATAPEPCAWRTTVSTTLTGRASDDDSGVASVVFSVVDEYGAVLLAPSPVLSPGERAVEFSRSLDVPARVRARDVDGRDITVTATVADAAGNLASTHVHVVVPFRHLCTAPHSAERTASGVRLRGSTTPSIIRPEARPPVRRWLTGEFA